MPKEIKLGLIQMKCGETASENLKKAVYGVEKAVEEGAQIICLPELFLSKYFCQEKNRKNLELAETVPGPTTERLTEIAEQKKVVIICPIFEKTADGKYFNSVIVIDADGKILGSYHKMHIPSLPPDLYAENYYFEKGEKGFLVFDTAYAKIAPMVCYDQWFPEGARIAAAKGAQILFYPTAIGWPIADREELNRAEHEAWQIIQRSHAIANNVFVAAVNRIGVEGNLKFWGSSFVSDPYGRVLASAPSATETNLVVPCDLEVIDKMRVDWPFLEERRIRYEDAN